MYCRTSNSVQRGAALVIALLVFALAAALMVGVQRDFNLQLQRSTNTFFGEQAWSFLLGAETLAELALRFDIEEDSKSEAPVDSLQELWAQPQAPYPIDDIGFLRGDLYDLQGRFNVNGLVDSRNNSRNSSDVDPSTPLGSGPAQAMNEPIDDRRLTSQQMTLVRLLRAIPDAELDLVQATRLVERITDFIDADRTPRSEGAEDEVYLSAAFPYRAPNRPLASVSELRAVDGMTPDLYRLVAPFLTVWPHDGSKINVLTASAEVLSALNEDDSLEPLSAQQVARIIDLRDAGLLTDIETFIDTSMFADDSVSELQEMIDIQSDWFLLDARVEIADRERRLYSVLHREGSAVSVVYRTEGEL